MDCKFVKYNMIDYLESQLKDPERMAFENHLACCENCRQVFDEVSRTYSLLDSDQEVQPNPFFYTRLEQKIKDQVERHSQAVPLVLLKALNPLAATLLILLSILTGVLIGSQFTESAYAGSTYDSELEYYTESVYFNNVDDEPIEYYLLNQNKE